MTTLKILLPVLALGTVLLGLPETAEAANPHRYDRPGHRLNKQRQPRFNRHHRNRVAAPELSVGSAAAALALLGGGLMVITGRRRVRKPE